MNIVGFTESGYYQIVIRGHLAARWIGKLGRMEIFLSPATSAEEKTVLQGRVADQAELSGILNSLYELHYSLLSLQYLGKSAVPSENFKDE